MGDNFSKFYLNVDPKTKRSVFLRTCRTIFANGDMFKIFEDIPRLSAGTKKFYDELTKLTISSIVYQNDEQYVTAVTSFILDVDRCPAKLSSILKTCQTQQIYKDIGQRIFERINRWREPTPAMCKVLSAIILMEDI